LAKHLLGGQHRTPSTAVVGKGKDTHKLLHDHAHRTGMVMEAHDHDTNLAGATVGAVIDFDGGSTSMASTPGPSWEPTRRRDSNHLAAVDSSGATVETFRRSQGQGSPETIAERRARTGRHHVEVDATGQEVSEYDKYLAEVAEEEGGGVIDAEYALLPSEEAKYDAWVEGDRGKQAAPSWFSSGGSGAPVVGPTQQ
jgi:hypothetical protein